MISITTFKSFKDQLQTLDELQVNRILGNFTLVERWLEQKSHLNVSKLSMLVKVKDSDYSIKYTFEKETQALNAHKIIKNI